MNDDRYDASRVGIANGNYFGFPWNTDDSEIVIVNVPWDATTSYRRGTSGGPEAMISASVQLDFYSFDNPGSGLVRCGTDHFLHDSIAKLNVEAGKASAQIIQALESGKGMDDPQSCAQIRKVNLISSDVERMVNDRCRYWMDKGKTVLVAGGEHSVPLGFLKALAERESSFGILQLDAHADLRKGFEGFVQSHASIMYNALSVQQISKLVQVGIRDVSEPEMMLGMKDPRITQFSGPAILERRFAGESWFTVCRDIVASLPEKVYLSFDIDGLEPVFCPNTGTPVPGGLTPDEAIYLLRMVAESGRVIIGADLCEVAPGKEDEWDANVGARLLYRIAVLIHHSHQPT